MGRQESLSLGQAHPGSHLFFPFGPAVLKPSLDLRLREIEGLGKLEPLRDAQILVNLLEKQLIN